MGMDRYLTSVREHAAEIRCMIEDDYDAETVDLVVSRIPKAELFAYCDQNSEVLIHLLKRT